MTTNELTKIWAKISGLFARKTEVATKADKAVVVTLSPDADQQIVADKTFAEVLALLQGGTEVVFDYQRTYMKVGVFHNTAIAAFAVDGNTIMSILWIKDNGITVSNTDLQEKLVFDNEPRKASTNPVTSAGLHEALQSKADTSTTYTKTEVNTALAGKQDVLTFDNVPTQSSNNPVKSGGVFTALQGKADTTALQNFCPLIEDTRTAEVSAITGIAPFSELKEGQRIMLHLAFVSKNNTTLTLTLSDGSTTPAIDVVISIGSQSLSLVMANILRLGGYYELVYDGVHWVVSGYDTNTIYSTMNQNNINTSHQQGQVVSAKLLVDNFDKRHLYVDNSADASVELSVATYNDLGTTDAPVVMLPASYTAADEFLYSFTCATDACVVTLPQGVVLADCCDDFSEVAAGVWFQVSIMDGVAAYLCVTPNN